jgi:hypothetical protein
VGDLRLICQMLTGCSATAAAYLRDQLPERDDGTHFLIWFMNWQQTYLDERQRTFQDIRTTKQVRLGIISMAADAA